MSGDAMDKSVLKRLVDSIDNWLLPIAFGTFTVLILAQLFTAIPTVRAYVDAVEGRFISQPVVVPPSVKSSSAVVTFYLSPASPRPDVQVFLNGQKVADFSKVSVPLTLHEDDTVQFRETGEGTVYIMVDHDDPKLFLPAPGQLIELTTQQPTYTLPKVQFTH